jgi:hypothetical protein
MAECLWLKPLLVAQIEYADRTDVNHLRHSKFIACVTTSRRRT